MVGNQTVIFTSPVSFMVPHDLAHGPGICNKSNPYLEHSGMLSGSPIAIPNTVLSGVAGHAMPGTNPIARNNKPSRLITVCMAFSRYTPRMVVCELMQIRFTGVKQYIPFWVNSKTGLRRRYRLQGRLLEFYQYAGIPGIPEAPKENAQTAEGYAAKSRHSAWSASILCLQVRERRAALRCRGVFEGGTGHRDTPDVHP